VSDQLVTNPFFASATLVGQCAPPQMLQMLTYLAMKHDPRVRRVDTVRAYSFGALYFVEVSWQLIALEEH